MELTHIAQREGRLSSFLREEMALSAGLMNRLKWKERILVNGKPEHTDYPVRPGDTITVCLEDPEIEYPAEDGPLTVLYEDEHLLAVDKPAGMLIHPSRSRLTGTLANFVQGYYQRTGKPVPSTPSPGWIGIPSAWCCWQRTPTSTACCKPGLWRKSTTL